MTHSAHLNQVRELAARFRAIAGTTEMPEYVEILSATASDLELRAASLDGQRILGPQRAASHDFSVHAHSATCALQAAR